MRCEECGTALYTAGERAPAGVYMRVDDGSFRRIVLAHREPLPASFDGHVAAYRSAATACACERSHALSASRRTHARASTRGEPLEPLEPLEFSEIGGGSLSKP